VAASASDDDRHRATDLTLVPARFGGDRSNASFELTADLARFDGALYGGTGAAVAVIAMEAASGRDAIYVATQFVAQARVGERIDWTVDTLASGARIAQMQVTARVGDRVVFVALGAAAHPRPGGLTGQYSVMPRVAPPEDCPPLDTDWDDGGDSPAPEHHGDFSRNLEFRAATVMPGEAAGSLVLWARLTRGRTLTPAGVAYVADMIPGAIARAAGRIGGGFSLDNALRFAEVPSATEWVLLDLRGDVASHGYGHGSFTAWSRDGALVATGGQTASMNHVWAPDDRASFVAWQQSVRDTARANAAQSGAAAPNPS
jgi:acyl-CoA thioesterase